MDCCHRMPAIGGDRFERDGVSRDSGASSQPKHVLTCNQEQASILDQSEENMTKDAPRNADLQL